MKNKMIALLCAAAMSVGMLSACGQAESSEQKSSEAPKSEETKPSEEKTEEVEEVKNFNEEGLPIVNEDITLKVMISMRDNDTAFIHPQDNWQLQEISEKTGINIEWEKVLASDWETKTNLMWATGEYPDVIFGTVDVEKYGKEEGVLLPLDDLLAQYAPNYTERLAMESSDITLAARASDGKLYSVPQMVAQNICTGNHLFINQTWLDALELDMPTDVDSLTDVLRAFKTGDPNGNGVADEIPVVGQIANCMKDMIPMFGVPQGSDGLFIDDNKEVQYAPVQDGYRECLEWFHLLYEEELLDPDAFTNDGNAITLKLIDSLAGFFSSWRLTDSGYNDGAKLDCVVYMPENLVMEKSIEFASNKVYITTANEYPEATMRWINELLETENMFSLYSGPEFAKEELETVELYGWYYDDNGKISQGGKSDALNQPVLNVNGIFFAPGTYYNEVFNMPPARVEKIEYSERAKEEGILQKYSNSYFKVCKFTGDTNDTVARLKTDLNTAMKESMVDFVKNGVTDESWNDWVALCEDIGYKELVQIYTEALSAVDVK